MNKINTTTWKYFDLAEFFDMKAGRYYAKDDYADGSTPLVTSSDQNNGIMAMTDLKPLFSHCITVGKVNMSVFYQKKPFCASSDVTVLIPKNNTPADVMLFFVTLLLKERYRFNYGNQIRLNDTLRLKVKLPTKNDRPDWTYMEKLINTHTHNYQYAAKPAHNLPTPTLKTSDWHQYRFDELFDIKKGKRLVEANFMNGRTPFIAAIDKNNGYRDYIGQRAIHESNTITVSYNGSIGEAFYQPKPYWASDDINVLYPKFELTPSIALFLATIIRKEKYRFNYGRKWDSNRMRMSHIKLPTKNSLPDWEYMTSFVQTLPFSSQI
jgi:hypothetical protein